MTSSPTDSAELLLVTIQKASVYRSVYLAIY